MMNRVRPDSWPIQLLLLFIMPRMRKSPIIKGVNRGSGESRFACLRGRGREVVIPHLQATPRIPVRCFFPPLNKHCLQLQHDLVDEGQNVCLKVWNTCRDTSDAKANTTWVKLDLVTSYEFYYTVNNVCDCNCLCVPTKPWPNRMHNRVKPMSIRARKLNKHVMMNHLIVYIVVRTHNLSSGQLRNNRLIVHRQTAYIQQ